MSRAQIEPMLNEIWNAGKTPRLMIDARHKDVIIPEHVREKHKERLPIDLKAEYPLNLEYTDAAIIVDLAFNGAVRCTIPWERIYIVMIAGTNLGAPVGKHPKDTDIIDDKTPAAPVKRKFGVIRGGKA